jgi:adenosylcobinamide-GDP ribazoletransferase
MNWRGWVWAPFIAVQFLTRIPINFIPDAAFDDWCGRRISTVFFPLVGVIVGSFGAAFYYISHALHLPAMAVAIVTVAATACMTGCFHEDGLADTCDALGPHNREDALRAMRDSRIGTFGAVGLWALLTLKVVAIVSLSYHQILTTGIAAHVLARLSSLPLALALPYAQEKGGKGGSTVQAISARTASVAFLVSICVLLWMTGLRETLIFLSLTACITFASGVFYRNKFGGISGDCLGATNQLVEVCILLAAATISTHV